MDQVLVRKLLNVKSPILITGPSGTGKSKLVAKIFNKSIINKEKFLTVHLASLKEDLLESELFGHRKGAFTGAVENKNGYFKDVGTGTLFLDEIGELTLAAQKKLLYILEEKMFTPVGATVAQRFEGRLIVATNKNLEEMVKAGTFREDLYFRLNIFRIELKSIGENKEKLLQSIHKLFHSIKLDHNKSTLRLSTDVENLLQCSSWPGNFRELKNCLEYVVALTDVALVEKEHLPNWFWNQTSPSQAKSGNEFISHFPEDYHAAIDHFEQWYLKAMLEKNEGKVNQTSRIIGISKATLIYKSKRFQIDTLSMRARANQDKKLNLVA